MELTSEELSNWRADPVTKKVFVRCVSMCEDIKEMMVNGMEPVDYHFNRGFIAGIRATFSLEGDDSK